MSQPPIHTPLTQLESADLIRRLVEAELAYSFKHNLIQETAYSSLLKNDRRTLHRVCAQTLEKLYADQLDEYAALLAQHYAEAGNDTKTLTYTLRAGQVAARRYAHLEALMQFDSARAVAQREPCSPEQLLELYTARGRSLEMIGRQNDAVENYMELRTLAHARGDESLELAALLPLATLYATPNIAQDLDKARELNMEALERARAVKNQQAEARVLWNLMLGAYFTGQPQLALEYGEQGIALARALNLREQLAFLLNDISRVYIGNAAPEKGIAALDEARTIFQEFDNLPMLADNLASTADALSTVGQFDAAL